MVSAVPPCGGGYGSHHWSQVDLTLMMTSAQVVETSVTISENRENTMNLLFLSGPSNSPSQDYTHPDDQTTLLQVI